MRKIQIVDSAPRSTLYYRDYCYAMNFYIREAGALRVLDHKYIDRHVQSRYTSPRWTNRWGEPGPQPEQIANLHDMCDRLSALKEAHKKMVYSSHVYLYSSNLEDLESIANVPYIQLKEITRAQVSLPENVVLLKEPKRKFRTYLKDCWVPESQSPILRKFLLSRRDCYDFTPLFKSRLEHWDRFYTMSHFFIDHDDPKDLLMLELVVPGLIRKTLPIQAK